MEINPEKALNFVIENAPHYAEAKANRRYLEEYKKTLKARLYQEAPGGTVADREAWAYSHERYKELLLGLKEAVKIEEELRWRMEAALTKTEVWRTIQASNRFIEKVTT